jgi:hypothetical protein
VNKDFNPVDRHEYERFYRYYIEKVNSAGAALATHGIDSPQFAEADKRAGEAWQKVRDASGQTGAHWSG